MLEIEPGRFLTFEYIGPVDYVGEAPGGERVRGSRCTSVDAAFRYRTSSGSVELALVEWKYTESYRPRDVGASYVASRYVASRQSCYGPTLSDQYSPVRDDVLPFERLLDEPLYQLVRQQLLAYRLERDLAEEADVVRVLHVLSPENLAYQASLREEVGGSVDEAWTRLLRSPDRFRHVDPAVFLDPAVTSREYVDRYRATSPSPTH